MIEKEIGYMGGTRFLIWDDLISGRFHESLSDCSKTSLEKT